MDFARSSMIDDGVLVLTRPKVAVVVTVITVESSPGPSGRVVEWSSYKKIKDRDHRTRRMGGRDDGLDGLHDLSAMRARVGGRDVYVCFWGPRLARGKWLMGERVARLGCLSSYFVGSEKRLVHDGDD
jgi:hypothetical protein